MIQVFKPSITQAEIDAVVEVLQSGWLGLGPRTAEFEQQFATYVGAKHAVGMNSATAALHLSLLALGIGPGDEVLIPTITFVSTAHAVRYCGATPVFVDVEADTLCIAINDLEKKVTERTKAVIPVHFGGHPCQMAAIETFAEAYGLFVVEDAAHACGSKHRGQRIGGLKSSVAACFSFHPVKNLVTPDGGMVTTHNAELAATLRRLRWCGITKSTWDRTETAQRGQLAQYGWYYEVVDLGYKAHMNDVAAAIGLVQLGRLEETNRKRRKIAWRYKQAFDNLGWLECPVERVCAESSWHNFVIKTRYRDRLNLYLKEKQIATGVHYMPLHLQPYYQHYQEPGSCPISDEVWLKLLTLPLYVDMTEAEVGYVISAVLDFGELL